MFIAHKPSLAAFIDFRLWSKWSIDFVYNSLNGQTPCNSSDSVFILQFVKNNIVFENPTKTVRVCYWHSIFGLCFWLFCKAPPQVLYACLGVTRLCKASQRVEVEIFPVSMRCTSPEWRSGWHQWFSQKTWLSVPIPSGSWSKLDCDGFMNCRLGNLGAELDQQPLNLHYVAPYWFQFSCWIPTLSRESLSLSHLYGELICSV